MSHLLAISFDCPATPSLQLQAINDPNVRYDWHYGWGFAWYPSEDYAAAVLKDAKTRRGEKVTQVLGDWQRFHSSQFVCHLSGAAKRITQQDTQPFSRSYAGRDWLMNHSGTLQSDFREKLLVGDNPSFEPMGTTDSEFVFCWLLQKVHSVKARRIADLDWTVLQEWFRTINELGTANIMLSDGQDLVVYQDKDGYDPLYFHRICPPHQEQSFELNATILKIDDIKDSYRTFVIFSSYKPAHADWNLMQSGQMLVTRRGAILWDSNYNQVRDTDVCLIKYAQNQLRINNNERQIIDSDHKVLNVTHETIYRYDRPVELSKHAFRLHPVRDRYQTILDFDLSISVDGVHENYDDVFGNRTSFYKISQSFTELIVKMKARVALAEIPSIRFSQAHDRQTIPLVWMPWQRQMMLPYLLPPELPESQLIELTDFAMSFVERNDQDVMEVLRDMCNTIYHDFSYVTGSTDLSTTPFEVYVQRRGVCQDFANLFICLARLLSIPARYRVGYIYTGGNYENKIQSDASHAWVEVYLPWLGWRGYDPTNGCTSGQDHIRVACGRNYFDATPTSGTIYKGGGLECLEIKVQVETP